VDHQRLVALAEKNGVLCTVEHHKRRCKVSLEHQVRSSYANGIPDLYIGFDPAYADAKGKARLLGDFNFFNSWMSQPKTQLETFKVRRLFLLFSPELTPCFARRGLEKIVTFLITSILTILIL